MSFLLKLNRICGVLSQYRFAYTNEAELHAGIASVFEETGLPFQHELTSGSHRFDFFCDGVVIEVKIKGSMAHATRQAARYCELDVVNAVVIVTTRHWDLGALEDVEIMGKPVRLVRIEGQAF